MKNVICEGRTVGIESKRNSASLAGALGSIIRGHHRWPWFQAVTEVKCDVFSEVFDGLHYLLGPSYAVLTPRYVGDMTNYSS